jgi:hypothetical protein
MPLGVGLLVLLVLLGPLVSARFWHTDGTVSAPPDANWRGADQTVPPLGQLIQVQVLAESFDG